MRIRLLGTGAADGIPAFCAKTPVSAYAREHGGKDRRTRAAALIDGELKLDFGPDTLAQIQRDGLDPSDWSAVLFTHSDDDHLTVSEFQYFLYPFNDNECLPFTIYGNETVCEKIAQQYPCWPLDTHAIHDFQPFLHGPYSITPLRANHKCDEEAHNFLIERDGRRLIYATDTGVWSEETFAFLERAEAHALVIECTDGFNKSDYQGHLDLKECVAMVRRMRKISALAEEARVVTTHHSHRGGARHCDLVQALGRDAIEPGYDGMEFDV